MSELSLSNFENELDPDVLDAGLALFQSGGLRALECTEEYFWSADFTENETEQAVLVEIKRDRVRTANCSCADFDPDTWHEEPCRHLVAMLYAVSRADSVPVKKTAAPKSPKAANAKPAARKAVAKKPGRKQDPAEALLGELEPKEIFDFVQQMLKNKEFKSQFLLHFSERSGRGEQQYEEIVAGVIQSVKGRRKYLKGADGAKIAATLMPLYKQAAGAEAKGYFREAFLICQTFMKHLPEIFRAMNTSSVKLENLYGMTLELTGQILQNPGTPFEFRDQVFRSLLQDYVERGKTGSVDSNRDLFKLVVRASGLVHKQADVATALESLISHYAAIKPRSRWSDAYYTELELIEQLVEYCDEELKDKNRAIQTLEAHKEHLSLYLMLVERLVAAGQYDKAIGHIEDIRKNSRKYQDGMSSHDLSHHLDEILLGMHRSRGDQKAAGILAARLFVDGNFRDFRYYELEKSVTEAGKWPQRVDFYLGKTKQTFSGLGILGAPYFEILTRETRWEQLWTDIKQVSNLGIWKNYGLPLAERYPEEFPKELAKYIDKAIRSNYYVQLTEIGELLKILKGMPQGAAVAQGLARKIREEYPQHLQLRRMLDKAGV